MFAIVESLNAIVRRQMKPIGLSLLIMSHVTK